MKNSKKYLMLIIPTVISMIVFLVFKDVNGEELNNNNLAPIPNATPIVKINNSCSDYPSLAGKCFSFRGRACWYNGGPPNLRIWMIGTHRLLGVCESCKISLPSNLKKALKDAYTEVYGTFTVCPIEPYEKGAMQEICIEKVEITKILESE